MIVVVMHDTEDLVELCNNIGRRLAAAQTQYPMLTCVRNWRSCPLTTDVASHMASRNSSIEESDLTCGYCCAWHGEGCALWYLYIRRPLHLPIAVSIPSYRGSELNLLIGGPNRIPNPEIKGELCHFTNSTASTYYPVSIPRSQQYATAAPTRPLCENSCYPCWKMMAKISSCFAIPTEAYLPEEPRTV